MLSEPCDYFSPGLRPPYLKRHPPQVSHRENMDQTGRGYLTNDKVYALMQEQLAMQKNMFKMKKVIIG